MSTSGPPPGRLTDAELRKMGAYYLGHVRQAWNTVHSKLVAGEQLDAQTYFDLAGEAIRQLENFSPQYPQEKREPFKRMAFQMTIVEVLLLMRTHPFYGEGLSKGEPR